MKLGVFDSGIGGEAVATSLRESFEGAEVIVVNDREHVPYGDRTANEITQLTEAAIQPLLSANCDVIVIACNSATAAAIEILRERYPDQDFVGLEPMIKPAATYSRSGIIAVCATPATLSSERYQSLKKLYGANLTIIEPNCKDWGRLIEHDALDERIIKMTINDVCMQGADVIVLACTHYHWIRPIIEQTAAARAVILDPSEAIAQQVERLLEA